jgi:hypothetical protein
MARIERCAEAERTAPKYPKHRQARFLVRAKYDPIRRVLLVELDTWLFVPAFVIMEGQSVVDSASVYP